MAFKLFLLWSFVLLGRPQDLLTFLQPMRPALLLAAVTTGGLIIGGHGKRLSAVFAMTEAKRYLFFFGIMILGIPFAYHRGVAFESIVIDYLSNMLFFFILVSEVNSLQRLKSLVLVISSCAFLYSFFGFLYGTYTYGRFEIYGDTFDPNDIAYVLISLFPLCFFFLHVNEGIFRRLLCITASCTSIVVVLLTGSRGGIIGLTAVLAIMLLTKAGRMKMSYKILFVILMGGMYCLIGDKINLERYLTLADIESDYNLTDEFGRIEVWKHGIAMTFDHPVTGVGVQCFEMALGYRREELGLLPKWQAAHNSYLQVATEVGLVGFVVFMLMNVQSFFAFLRISRMQAASNEACQIRTLGGLMLVGFAGHLVTAFFLSHGYSGFFTLFFALAAVIRRLQSELKADPIAGEVGNDRGRRSGLGLFSKPVASR